MGAAHDAAAAGPYGATAARRAQCTTTGTGAVVCSLTGDLDLDGLEGVRSSLDSALRSGAEVLVLDLERLGFCDSSGLNLLLSLRLEAQEVGAALRLGAPTRQLRRLLELTGTNEIFSVHPTVADALASP